MGGNSRNGLVNMCCACHSGRYELSRGFSGTERLRSQESLIAHGQSLWPLVNAGKERVFNLHAFQSQALRWGGGMVLVVFVRPHR